MIKILYLIGSYGIGGKERQLAELIKNLPKDEFSLHLLIKERGAYYLQEFEKQLGSFLCLNRRRFGFASFKKIIDYINTVQPDIVHSWATPTSVFAILARPFSKKKYFFIDGSIRQHNLYANELGIYGIERRIISRYSDLIVSNSRAGLASYSISPAKGLVIYNGFDFKRIKQFPVKKDIVGKFGIQAEYIIGMVARFVPQKDYNSFIEAAQSILLRRDDVRFFCIGGGRLLNDARRNVHPQNVPKIVFSGEISNVEEMVNCFDIGVLMTNHIEMGEGISNAIMEYMALGKPVIASRGGSNDELISEGETGFLIDLNDSANLVKRIEKLLADDVLRRKMGSAGKSRIEKIFGIDKMIAAYSDLYRRYGSMSQ